ncbi:Acetylcholinesterase-1 [Cytospora mali]|uniref:Carboxylic ester hydrolase n=1 Tax=Cytospora mali TaxID=578113 RepID=A0A194UP48_CYTMA|nr:Acetylcholinesterase-1 [Valsa mali var. pyri (nom. inval.)]
MSSLILSFTIMAAATLFAMPTTSPVVSTAKGSIHGGTCPDTEANYFLSIPFAEPPLGDLRFASPQPYSKTFGNLDATSPAPSCIQFTREMSGGSIQSEDCLYLDIWTPANASASSSSLPVKVWLYGGTNQYGSISYPLYQGCESATDAIIVSLNYRSGPLGWFALEDAELTGNFALQDQLLGLRWVQENIRAFGGDPSKVLLFGQSAGAIDALAISTLPEATSYMKAVALESTPGSYFPTLSQAAEWNRLFASELNCTSSSTTTNLSAQAIRKCLRNVSVSQLNSTVSIVSTQANPNFVLPLVGTPYNNYGQGNAWGPNIDGSLITQSPAQAGSRVPLIIGSNSQDGTFYTFAAYGTSSLTLTKADYDDFLVGNFGPYASLVNQTYPLSLFNKTSFPVFEAMSTVVTHSRLRCFSRTGADVSTRNHGVSAYTYSFNHAPSCDWMDQVPNRAAILELLGAAHTAEIAFVFGHTQNLPPPSGTCYFTSAEVTMSKWMVGAWTNMAMRGSPGMEWPAFEAGGEGLGLNFGDESVVGEIDYSMCDFWDSVWEDMLE